MKFASSCPECGHQNQFEWSRIGKTARCQGCGLELTVPRPQQVVEESSTTGLVLRFLCPSCGRKFATRANLAGKKIRCGGCGAGVRVPGKPGFSRQDDDRGPDRPAKVPASSRPAALDDNLADDFDAYGLVDEPVSTPPERVETALPARNELFEQARQKAIAAGKTPDPIEKSDSVGSPKKKKKRKKQTGFFDPRETMKLVAGVGAFVAILVFLAWRFPEFRFPLGGAMCVIGFIVYLLGAVSLRQLVAEEGMFRLLAYRFFPPYQWWFVISRWSDAKDYFAFFAAGLLILSLGGMVLRISPQGQRAELAEQAFLKATQGTIDEDDDAEDEASLTGVENQGQREAADAPAQSPRPDRETPR